MKPIKIFNFTSIWTPPNVELRDVVSDIFPNSHVLQLNV